MPLPVSLKAVVDELEMLIDESHAYLNKLTGEIVTLGDEESRAAEEGDDIDDYPEWQQEEIKVAAKVLGSDDYLRLPDKFEIHDYEIMQRFCWSIEDDDVSHEFAASIRGSGAFRRFEEALHRHGMSDHWHRFHHAALEEIAIRWLEAEEIPYIRDTSNDISRSS